MNNFINETKYGSEERREGTARELLENMGNIFREMKHELAMISGAVYRGETCTKEEPDNEPCTTPPMIVIMQLQRDAAEDLLKEIVKIREALW